MKAEQTRKLGQLRLLHLQQMAQIQDDAWLIHMAMKEELMNKKKEIRRAQMAFYQMIRGLHWAHAKAVSDLRNEFAREVRRLETSYDRGLFEKNERLEEEHDRQMGKLAVAKEEQIKYLIDDHAWQADQMKAFFQELLKISLDIVQQMKIEVKQQTTAELMQRRDYEHFKHRYDVYVTPALRWSTLMDEWTVVHQEDDLQELVSTLKLKEDELKKRKYNLRMLEAANEALNQRILIAEKERNCIKKQFCRSIVDSQRTTSMKRFCHQLKRKAARDDAEIYLALNKLVRDRGTGINHFKHITDQKDEEALDLMLDINQHAREHLETQYAFADAFNENEINLDDIGFPIQQVGVQHVNYQDMENLMEANKNWKPPDDEEGDNDEWWMNEVDSGYDLVDAPTTGRRRKSSVKLILEPEDIPDPGMQVGMNEAMPSVRKSSLRHSASYSVEEDDEVTTMMGYDEEGDEESTMFSGLEGEIENNGEWEEGASAEEMEPLTEKTEDAEETEEEISPPELQERNVAE